MKASGNLSRFLEALSLGELKRAVHDWPTWSGRKQRPPLIPWRTWLMLGGRGAGKTRAGAQWLSGLIGRDGHYAGDAAGRVAIIGETYADARAVMVEGESGLLAVSAPGWRPQWNAAQARTGLAGRHHRPGVFRRRSGRAARQPVRRCLVRLISVAAAFTGMIGITLDAGDQSQIAEAMVQIVGALGALMAIHGRLSATEVIS